MIIRRRKPAKTKVDMTALAIPKRGDGEVPEHRRWVRGFACLVPGCNRQNITAHHERRGTVNSKGEKPHDKWCAPICMQHHNELHTIGANTFDRNYRVDVKAIAKRMAQMSPHRLKWERTQDE